MGEVGEGEQAAGSSDVRRVWEALHQTRPRGAFLVDSDWGIVTPAFLIQNETFASKTSPHMVVLVWSLGTGQIPVGVVTAIHDFGDLESGPLAAATIETGVSMCGGLCKTFQVTATADPLRALGVDRLDLMLREIQMIKKSHASLSSSAGWRWQELGEDRVYTASPMLQGNVWLGPELKDWVLTELQRQASSRKDVRKASEGKDLLQEPPAKKQK